jgi:hypothetical protein
VGWVARQLNTGFCALASVALTGDAGDVVQVATWQPELPLLSEIAWKLGWSTPDYHRYAEFRVRLNDIVGMAAVKELIQDTIHDAVRRPLRPSRRPF